MQADELITEITSKIVPDLNAVTEEARQGWSPTLLSSDVRSEIFDSSVLSIWVLEQLVSLPVLTQVEDLASNEVLEALLFLTDADAAHIATNAGMIWHSNQLARMVSCGDLSISELGWDMVDVRRALRLRAHSGAPDVSNVSFCEAVTATGQACLSAWLEKAPKAVNKALEIAASPLGAAFRAGHRSPEKARIFDICLQDMRAAS